MSATIHIKNMVCPRCIATVEQVLKQLGIDYLRIELGAVILHQSLSTDEKVRLKGALEQHGFQLLEDQKSQLIGKIKGIVINEVHYPTERLNVNFSTLLSEQLHHDYSTLSRLFSTVEGITIERFIIAQKIERIKELIVYNELSLSEIAFQMNYSSVAHLSAQFKKETGMTPTAFRHQTNPGRKSLDAL